MLNQAHLAGARLPASGPHIIDVLLMSQAFLSVCCR